MSRIGNRKLTLPENVEIKITSENLVTIKGPKGKLEKYLPKEILILCKDRVVTTERKNDLKRLKQLHGTTNSLIQGMIIGVTKGFEKKLEIVGVGYKANLKDGNINLSLGFSHPITYKVPKTINITIPTPVEIIIQGIDKQLVGEVSAQIRAYKKPEPYKGKGIKYSDEYIIRKEGKSAGK